MDEGHSSLVVSDDAVSYGSADESSTPPHEKDDRHLQSSPQAFINIIKANVGSGILGIPYAISRSGLWLGIMGVFLVVTMATRCINMLVECKRTVDASLRAASPSKKSQSATYSDIGRHVYGRLGVFMTEFSLVFTQLGFCCVYLVFIGKNMNSLHPSLSETEWVILSLCALIPISWLPSLRLLAPTSLFSEIALLFGMGTVCAYSIQNLNWTNISNNVTGFNILGFPIFFGTCVYSYEGVGLVLPIEDSMKKPQKYQPLLYLALAVITIMTLVFGTLGYLGHPTDVQSVITMNLPDNGIAVAVKYALCIALLFTYPVQMFPVSKMIDRYMLEALVAIKSNGKHVLLAESTLDSPAVEDESLQEEEHHSDHASLIKKRSPASSSIPVAHPGGSVPSSSSRFNSNHIQHSEAPSMHTSSTSVEPWTQRIAYALLLEDGFSWQQLLRRNMYRALLCVSTAALAIAIPKFDLFISLVGSFGSALLAFILPALFSLKMFGHKKSQREKIGDYAILVLGVIGCVICTSVTIDDLVNALK